MDTFEKNLLGIVGTGVAVIVGVYLHMMEKLSRRVDGELNAKQN